MAAIEPILAKSAHRFCLFPIQYPTVFDFYLKHQACFWTVAEVDLKQDKADYDKLTSGEQGFIMKVLAFFANADGIVNENLAERFSSEVTMPEARQFYGFQIGMETIHSHMYGVMIDTLVKDAARRNELFHAITEVPSVAGKAEWALKWLGSDRPFAERLIAFACVEGIFFSASFCAIYYMKKRGIMPGLTFSNELIARDEALHRDFATHLFSFLQNKPDTATVHDIVRSAMECEVFFVRDALHVDLIGMNADLMEKYVQVVADNLIETLGYPKIYNQTNPFEFMDLIALSGKTNFFEKRVGDYQKAGVMHSAGGAVSKTLVLDDDF
tara:strand:- start:736 stop:1716 length:981 start_codon:yes stop_codon:yes gene_type:complete